MRILLIALIPLTLSGCFSGSVNDLRQDKLIARIQAKGFDSLSCEDQYVVTHGLHGIQNPHDFEHVLRMKTHFKTHNNQDGE